MITETILGRDDGDLVVNTGGDGPTVVLVHGFPDDHTAWDGVVEHLSADHRVVTFDTRGSGRSARPRRIRDYRLDRLVEDLQAVIDHVDEGEGVHLVGHDWGSVQGWHLVTDPHHRGVVSFTSISGPCLDHVPGWVRRQWRARRYRDVAALWKSPIYMGLFSVPVVAPLLARLGLVDPVIRLALKVFETSEPTTAASGPSARRNAASIRIYAANVLPRLLRPTRSGTDVPVQVLAPRRDIFVPPVTQADPPADVHTIEVRDIAGGHWAPTYQPRLTSEAVASWVARHPTADSTQPHREPN